MLGKWGIDLLEKFVIDVQSINDKLPIKINIPKFHHSIIP